MTIPVPEPGDLVCGGALVFSKGHPLLKFIMEHLEENYNPECWGCIGPLLITTCIKLFTGVMLIKQ